MYLDPRMTSGSRKGDKGFETKHKEKEIYDLGKDSKIKNRGHDHIWASSELHSTGEDIRGLRSTYKIMRRSGSRQLSDIAYHD